MANITEFLQTDIDHKSDFVANGGDLATVSGLENVKQAIIRRLMTTPGSVAFRPTYGAGLEEFQNAAMSYDNQQTMASRIETELAKDDRIESVSSVEFQTSDANPGIITLIVSVKIKGYGDTALTFNPFGESA